MSELKLPELGENIDVVDVSAVLVAVGEEVRRDQPVIEVETEKASLEVPAVRAGRITELRVRQGDKISVGQVILVFEDGPAASPAASEPSPVESKPQAVPEPQVVPEPQREPVSEVVAFPAKTDAAKPSTGEPVPAAPSVRALARELGVDLHRMTGSGPRGRISRDDVKEHAKALILGAAAPSAAAVPALPDFTRWGEVERAPLSNVRRATATRMSQAWAQVPHVTQFDNADITELEAMRKRFNQRPEAEATRLSVTAIVVKLCAAALGKFPKFNASLDLAAQAVIYKRYVHIGVAVDTERGLLVPVIRDVDRKGLLDVTRELGDVAARARNKKVRPDELQGAGFTVSNLGGLGTTYFSPIVNWPEVAILGVGRAEPRAVHRDGRFEPRLILPLSVSYDHRLIDGADAARFLRWVAEALEQPLLLLLDNR